MTESTPITLSDFAEYDVTPGNRPGCILNHGRSHGENWSCHQEATHLVRFPGGPDGTVILPACGSLSNEARRRGQAVYAFDAAAHTLNLNEKAVEKIETYFQTPGILALADIDAHFPGQGWVPVTRDSLFSLTGLTAAAEAGVTAFSVQYGGRTVDFQIEEVI